MRFVKFNPKKYNNKVKSNILVFFLTVQILLNHLEAIIILLTSTLFSWQDKRNLTFFLEASYNQKLPTNLSYACCDGVIDCSGSCLLAGSQLFKGRSDREGVSYHEKLGVREGENKKIKKIKRDPDLRWLKFASESKWTCSEVIKVIFITGWTVELPSTQQQMCAHKSVLLKMNNHVKS